MKQRLQYFDMLKGFAIFMVVMGHVITICIREIDKTALFKIIAEVHMPLFFFISGWMSWHGGRRPDLRKRALQLLPPMLVCSTLWVFYFPHSGLESPFRSTFSELWFSLYKNGYWFTLVLFEIFVIYFPVAAIIRRCRNIKSEVALCIIIEAILYFIHTASATYCLDKLASFELVVNYFPVFMIGVLAAKHHQGFIRLTESQTWTTASFILGGINLYIVCWPWEFPHLGYIPKLFFIGILHICLAIVAVAVVKPWSEEAFGPEAEGHRLARMWSYIGQQSLAIYLLHYFFLFPMGCLRPLLESMSLDFVPAFAVSFTTAAIVVAIVLMVNRILQPSAMLSWLLAGHLPKFQFKEITKASTNNE